MAISVCRKKQNEKEDLAKLSKASVEESLSFKMRFLNLLLIVLSCIGWSKRWIRATDSISIFILDHLETWKTATKLRTTSEIFQKTVPVIDGVRYAGTGFQPLGKCERHRVWGLLLLFKNQTELCLSEIGIRNRRCEDERNRFQLPHQNEPDYCSAVTAMYDRNSFLCVGDRAPEYLSWS